MHTSKDDDLFCSVMGDPTNVYGLDRSTSSKTFHYLEKFLSTHEKELMRINPDFSCLYRRVDSAGRLSPIIHSEIIEYTATAQFYLVKTAIPRSLTTLVVLWVCETIIRLLGADFQELFGPPDYTVRLGVHVPLGSRGEDVVARVEYALGGNNVFKIETQPKDSTSLVFVSSNRNKVILRHAAVKVCFAAVSTATPESLCD